MLGHGEDETCGDGVADGLDAQLPGSRSHDEVEDVVVAQGDLGPVDVEEDRCRGPGQPLVAVAEGRVRDK